MVGQVVPEIQHGSRLRKFLSQEHQLINIIKYETQKRESLWLDHLFGLKNSRGNSFLTISFSSLHFRRKWDIKFRSKFHSM